MDEKLTLSAYVRDAVAFMRMAEATDTELFDDLYNTYRNIITIVLDRYVRPGRMQAVARKSWLSGWTYWEISLDYGYVSTQTVRNYMSTVFADLDEITCDATEFFELGEINNADN